MLSFTEWLELNELSVGVLSRYIRRANDETEEPKQTQRSNDWDKVMRRERGSTLAKLKMRKYAVKVPAGRATKDKVKAAIGLKKRLSKIEIDV